MNPDDPMSLGPEDQLEFFSSRRHWFHWKAPVMESGMPVIVLPVHVDNVMYPTGNPLEPLAWSKGHSVQNPGGEATTGAFTTRWVAWWSTEAPRVFDETVKPDAEVELSNAVRLTSRARRGTVGVSAMTDYEALMRAIFLSDLPLANKIQLEAFLRRVTGISDVIEDAADRLYILVIRERI